MTTGRRLALFAAAVWLTLAAGCMNPPLDDPTRIGPFFAPVNHVGEPALGDLRRVVLLPVSAGTLAPRESAMALDPVLATALQGTRRFEVVTLTRAECFRRFGAEEFSSAAALPRDFLPVLQREFAADAVLFVDLTVYSAYRPLALGLRAKLAAADGSRLIWTFDEIFSAADPATANGARHHFLERDRGELPIDLSPAVLQSPARFAAYATATMFATLPPVVVPAAPAVAPAAPAQPDASHAPDGTDPH